MVGRNVAPMSDESRTPTVPVVCPECGTTTRVAVSEVAETVVGHNDARHDGTEVAHVDPTIVERIADLAAEDLGLDPRDDS
jgi:RNase P subunit RPR2